MQYSRNSILKDIINDEKARKVLVERTGQEIINHPMMKLVENKSLAQIQRMSNGQITEQMLDELEEILGNL